MKNTIGLGTAAIGRPLYINMRQETATVPFAMDTFRQKGISVLESAYQNGIRHFDTAPGYGLAEQLLLHWIKEKNDPTITISTKWGYTYVANFDPNAKLHEVKEHSLEKLQEQWEVSQELLPYLKSYQIHSATFESGVLANEEVLQYLYHLKKEHAITIGLTTTGTNQRAVLEKALTIMIAEEQLFQSIQCTYNILDQSMLGIQESLSKLSGPVIIKEALANGRLIPNATLLEYQPLYAYMEQLADHYNVGTDAIALRFCMDSFADAIVLSGANTIAHLSSNCQANSFCLSEEECAKLHAFGRAPEDYWNERKQLAWN